MRFISLIAVLLLAMGIAIADDVKESNTEANIAKLQEQWDDYFNAQMDQVTMATQKAIEQLQTGEFGGFTSMAARARFVERILELNGYRESKMTPVPRRYNETVQDRLTASPKRFADAMYELTSQQQAAMQRGAAAMSELEASRMVVEETIINSAERESIATSEPKALPVKGLVTGILYSQDKPMAIVSGKVVRIDDEIDGVKIADITADRVSFQRDRSEWQQIVAEEPDANW